LVHFVFLLVGSIEYCCCRHQSTLDLTSVFKILYGHRIADCLLGFEFVSQLNCIVLYCIFNSFLWTLVWNILLLFAKWMVIICELYNRDLRPQY
jgi:hypothetical protein